jgi:hypothetical protein
MTSTFRNASTITVRFKEGGIRCVVINALLFISLSFVAITAKAGNDLRAVYESLAASDLDAAAIQKVFDLNRADVSAFMLGRMNTFTKKGDGASAEEVMASMLRADPGKGIEWLLKNYGQFSAVGRVNAAQSLRHSDTKEAFQILSAMLDDKETAVNEHAAAIAPISPATAYVHLRVCDSAYGALLWLLRKDEKLPSNLPRTLMWDTSTADRNQSINRLTAWYTQESSRLLSQKPSLATSRQSLKEKIRAFEKKLR